MLVNKKNILYIGISLILSFFIVFSGFVQVKSTEPREVFRVYLNGESIGLIESKEALDNYINNEQQSIKDKYGVNKIYAPTDLLVEREITYTNDIDKVEDVYERIKATSPFTIEGYAVTISSVELIREEEKITTKPVTIYVLDKQVFLDAMDTTIKAFVDSEKYEQLINNTQEDIVDTGTILEDVYIQNNVSSIETNIPVNATIYTDPKELSKFLLYGTTTSQKTYVVKQGDTIESVSFNNKLNEEEFLISNPEFKSKDVLLFAGQVVTIGVLDPQVQVVEESHVVERTTTPYNIEYVDDATQYIGYEKVKTEGTNGVNLVTEKIKKQNGEVISYVVAETKVEVPTINKVIIRGIKVKDTGGYSVVDDSVTVTVDLSQWRWPTGPGYFISSGYAWRWGKLHAGIDVTGTGEGSPIYAVNNGVVVYAGWRGYGSGNTVWIKHKNGEYSEYAHMQSVTVKAGQVVYVGQQIGKMGHTGNAYGTHLHFGMWYGKPFVAGSFNPCRRLGC